MPLSFSEIEAILNLQTLIQGRADLQAAAGGRVNRAGAIYPVRPVLTSACPIKPDIAAV